MRWKITQPGEDEMQLQYGTVSLANKKTVSPDDQISFIIRNLTKAG